MLEPEIWTFFYGSYINFDVLREVNFIPSKWEIARLAGFDIFIRPACHYRIQVWNRHTHR